MLIFQFISKLFAVHSRHDNIGYQKVDKTIMLFRYFESSHWIRGKQKRMLLQGEHFMKQISDIFIIFDQHNGFISIFMKMFVFICSWRGHLMIFMERQDDAYRCSFADSAVYFNISIVLFYNTEYG